MCGRFALAASPAAIAEYLDCDPPQQFAPRYNIAPTTPVLARAASGLTFFRWGLVPSWARDVSMGNRMFNARAETIREKPSFRNAFKRRRCLVPASGFYEWHKKGEYKQPFYCHLKQPLFCFGGIWEYWQDGAGNELQSCAILTTEAVGAMAQIHQRMPVVIRHENHASWLNHGAESTDEAMDCIAELDADFEIYPVSSRVNNSRHEGAGLIEPMAEK